MPEKMLILPFFMRKDERLPGKRVCLILTRSSVPHLLVNRLSNPP